MVNGDHKILQSVSDGRIFFAKVGVVSSPSNVWTIVWSADLNELYHVYRDAAEQGVRLAAARQDDLGGASYEVEIVSVLETPSDTRADVVTCAAAMAAWKSWGHLESEASLSFEDDQWRISFEPA